MHPFLRLSGATKRIPVALDWANPHVDSEYIWIEYPIDINGVIEHGLVLHVGCLRDRPECNVSFELRLARNPGRRCVPLMRIDWRAISGGHTNQVRHGTEWAGRRVDSTHYHAFDLNWDADRQRMKRDNLPVAMPISEPLEAFESLRFFAGKEFRISNIDVVPRPPWEYKLV